MNSSERYAFVALTGDLGIEELVNVVIGSSQSPINDALKDNQINSALEAEAVQLADVISQSSVTTWLFVPGNNDLFDENPQQIEFYTHFVESLAAALKQRQSNVQVRDLITTGPYTSGPYVFIGFNNASFKNNNNPARVDRVAFGPSTASSPSPSSAASPVKSLTRLDLIKQHLDKGLTPAVVFQEQKKSIEKVEKEIEDAKAKGRQKGQPVYNYILYHVPEIDDPDLALNNPDKRLLGVLRNRINYLQPVREKDRTAYLYSAWFVDPDVYDLWIKTAQDETVRGLFAGHLHDRRRTSYLNSSWLRTSDYRPDLVSKLHICPPLAKKFQPDLPDARGFQVVSINSTGMIIDERGGPGVHIFWYNRDTGNFSDDRERRGDMFEGLVSAYTMWALLAAMLIAGLLGGWINYYLTREAQESENSSNENLPPISLRRSLLIGLGAAILVPLFLNMTSSNLIEEIRGGANVPAQPYKLFVFTGFCLAAAISSRAFIRTISDRIAITIAQKANQKADKAITKTDEAEENFEQSRLDPESKPIIEIKHGDFMRTAAKEPTVISVEPESVSDTEEPEPVSDKERLVLRNIADSGYRFRTTSGLASDTRLKADELETILMALANREMIGRRKGKKGELWYIKTKGRRAIGDT